MHFDWEKRVNTVVIPIGNCQYNLHMQAFFDGFCKIKLVNLHTSTLYTVSNA